jgi:hypothetical protein
LPTVPLQITESGSAVTAYVFIRSEIVSAIVCNLMTAPAEQYVVGQRVDADLFGDDTVDLQMIRRTLRFAASLTTVLVSESDGDCALVRTWDIATHGCSSIPT